MIAPHVSRRYAKALLELGQEAGGEGGLTRDLAKAAEAYEASAELRRSLENPLVGLDAKKAILTELAERLSLSSLARTALFLLADRGRTALLPEIVQLLREMSDLRAGLLHAEVTTAVPMSESFYERLKQTLERLTGRRVVLDKKVDATIIAGVVTRIGDRVLDGSLKARLGDLKHAPLN